MNSYGFLLTLQASLQSIVDELRKVNEKAEQPYARLRHVNFLPDGSCYDRAQAAVLLGQVRARDFYLMRDVVDAALQYDAACFLGECARKLTPPSETHAQPRDVSALLRTLRAAVGAFQKGE